MVFPFEVSLHNIFCDIVIFSAVKNKVLLYTYNGPELICSAVLTMTTGPPVQDQ